MVSRRAHPGELCPALLPANCKDETSSWRAGLSGRDLESGAGDAVRFRAAVLSTASCRSAAQPITPGFRPAVRAGGWRTWPLAWLSSSGRFIVLIVARLTVVHYWPIPGLLCFSCKRHRSVRDDLLPVAQGTPPTLPAHAPPVQSPWAWLLPCQSLYSTSALSAFLAVLNISRHTFPAPCCRGSCCSLLAPSNHCIIVSGSPLHISAAPSTVSIPFALHVCEYPFGPASPTTRGFYQGSRESGLYTVHNIYYIVSEFPVPDSESAQPHRTCTVLSSSFYAVLRVSTSILD